MTPSRFLSLNGCGDARYHHGLTAQLPQYLAGGLLLVMFALLVFSVSLKSPTLDEQNHIARGLAYLWTGDLRLSQEHPPLINVWEAWPLLLDPRVRLPLDSLSWTNAEWYGFADQLLWQVNGYPQAMVFATRVPVMWLTLLLAALAYRWARELGGDVAGLLTLGLLVFDPNILAHGRLTTTDMGATCTTLAAMLALWRALHVPRWSRWMAAGVVLGLAQTAKFSAAVLGPLVLLVVFLSWVVEWIRERSPRRTWAWVLRLVLLFGVEGLVIWAVYGFQWGPVALLNDLPGPAPAYWAGLRAILNRAGSGTEAFLMGQYSETGWWYYFPVAFAIKTPLPTLILLLVAVGVAGRKLQVASYRPHLAGRAPSSATFRPANCHPQLLCLLLPVLSFWAMALAGGFNIGYRHILPTLPCMYVLAGWQLGEIANCQSPVANRKLFFALGSLLLAVCYLFLALNAIRIFPHYLAFFNLLAGGPDGGRRFLVDSNLDWGQDLPGLARYVQKSGIECINLSWFGAAHPEAYSFDFHPLPGFWRFGDDPAAYGFNPYHPAPGWYAISASNLQGLKLAVRDTYAWFRKQKPVANVGYSILIYQVQEQTVPGEAVVLGVPTAQLAEGEQELLRRATSVRRFDLSTGWVVPDMSQTWFIAPQLPEWGHPIRSGPGYVLFQSVLEPADGLAQDVRFGLWVSLLDRQAEGTDRGSVVSLSRQEALTVRAWWAVRAVPHRAAVSFAHLLDAEGRYVAGWDGLSVPATCWQVGDRLRQDYPIGLPDSLRPGTYQIEVGWYDADTLVRWPCFVNGEPFDAAHGEPSGDRWLLPDVKITK